MESDTKRGLAGKEKAPNNLGNGSAKLRAERQDPGPYYMVCAVT